MKISIKLGLWFFICILIIEIISMDFLHSHIVESQIHQELSYLKNRGNSRRDVLEMNSDSTTLKHIETMEANTDTDVIITNNAGAILLASDTINQKIQTILNIKLNRLPRDGKVLQSDWKNKQYIATVTAFYQDGDKAGYVYMFKNTNEVQKLISQLNKHFLFASVLIVFFMLITVFFLSRALTKPLISMKEATKKLSKGDFSVTLPTPSRDELGELAKSIQSLADDLNYLKKERNEFLASISHELRTPLTYISGYADIAKREGLDDTERGKYLEIIQEESERVSHLLKDLFEMAKLDQNNFVITKEETNVYSFLQSIYEKVLPAFLERKHQLELECPVDLMVLLDPARFEQVILNLLDNSLKYSQEDSTTVINVFEDAQSVHILLKDEGLGIPDKDLPHIFDRLYRVEKSRSRATGGSGLGLAIVKQLVEAHEGTISVESQLGEGTFFHITLPKSNNNKVF